MIDLGLIFSIALICIVIMVSPGPNFVAVSHRAATKTRKDALIFTYGIVTASMIWATSTLLGINLIFSVFPWLFLIIKIIGGLYLSWLGLKIIKNSKVDKVSNIHIINKGKLSIYKDGIIVNLSNPKALILYASIFSASIPKNTSDITLLLIIVTTGVISLLWYGFIAIFFSHKKVLYFYEKFKIYIESICGILLILFGIRQIII